MIAKYNSNEAGNLCAQNKNPLFLRRGMFYKAFDVF
jgi:hypothetical protein